MTAVQQVIKNELWARLDEVMRPDGSMHQLDIGPTTLGDWLGDCVYAALLEAEARPAHWGSVADLQAAYSELAAKLDEAETALMAAEATVEELATELADERTLHQATMRERDQLRTEEAKYRAEAKQLWHELGMVADVVHKARAWRAQYTKPSIFPRVAALHAAVDALEAADSDQAHRYTSTACHHGRHGDCATGGTRWDGTSKVPAQCKYCDARCECRECDHKGSMTTDDQDTRRSTPLP